MSSLTRLHVRSEKHIPVMIATSPANRPRPYAFERCPETWASRESAIAIRVVQEGRRKYNFREATRGMELVIYPRRLGRRDRRWHHCGEVGEASSTGSGDLSAGSSCEGHQPNAGSWRLFAQSQG
jgi:hypothetical protein